MLLGFQPKAGYAGGHTAGRVRARSMMVHWIGGCRWNIGACTHCGTWRQTRIFLFIYCNSLGTSVDETVSQFVSGYRSITKNFFCIWNIFILHGNATTPPPLVIWLINTTHPSRDWLGPVKVSHRSFFLRPIAPRNRTRVPEHPAPACKASVCDTH